MAGGLSDATKQKIVEYASVAVAAALGASVAQGVASRMAKSQVARVVLVGVLSGGMAIGGLYVADEISKKLKLNMGAPSKSALVEAGAGAALAAAGAVLLASKLMQLSGLSRGALISVAAAAGAAGGLALSSRYPLDLQKP